MRLAAECAILVLAGAFSAASKTHNLGLKHDRVDKKAAILGGQQSGKLGKFGENKSVGRGGVSNAVQLHDRFSSGSNPYLQQEAGSTRSRNHRRGVGVLADAGKFGIGRARGNGAAIDAVELYNGVNPESNPRHAQNADRVGHRRRRRRGRRYRTLETKEPKDWEEYDDEVGGKDGPIDDPIIGERPRRQPAREGETKGIGAINKAVNAINGGSHPQRSPLYVGNPRWRNHLPSKGVIKGKYGQTPAERFGLWPLTNSGLGDTNSRQDREARKFRRENPRVGAANEVDAILEAREGVIKGKYGKTPAERFRLWPLKNADPGDSIFSQKLEARNPRRQQRHRNPLVGAANELLSGLEVTKPIKSTPSKFGVVSKLHPGFKEPDLEQEAERAKVKNLLTDHQV